jgi:diketogulonate reductase-like aldo/keto reductase
MDTAVDGVDCPVTDPRAMRRKGGDVQASSRFGASGFSPGRRRCCAALAGALVAGPAAAADALLMRRIPSTGDSLPAIGLGSWITFNVGADRTLRRECAAVVKAFLDGGGRIIDSSPMYGSSQPVIGEALGAVGDGAKRVYAADKVWTGDGAQGAAQVEASRRLWGVPRFDLLQVHNLLAWEAHLPMLLAMKAAGRVRHVGITTSEGRRHADIERVMRTQPIDFVQLTYNPADREAEARLLPLAQERGIAVIANRPFREGALLRRLQRQRVPAYAAEIDCDGWAQLVLKFIVTHPAVTCAIPATSRVDHVRQNLGAMRGRQPDEALRRRIAADVEALV